MSRIKFNKLHAFGGLKVCNYNIYIYCTCIYYAGWSGTHTHTWEIRRTLVQAVCYAQCTMCYVSLILILLSYRQTEFRCGSIGVGTMGAPGAGAPLYLWIVVLARLNFIHYRFIEPPFIKPSSYDPGKCTPIEIVTYINYNSSLHVCGVISSR
jgi:hypothetical protein